MQTLAKHLKVAFDRPAINWQAALPWVMWGLSAFFYFYEFLLQVSPSVMVPELMRAFNISAHSLGLIASMYFPIYAAMQIPVGVLLDRFGPRKLLTFAAAICAFGSYLFSVAETTYLAMFARTLIGFGSAFAVVGSMKIVANWFPRRLFAMMLGLIITLGMVGAMCGEEPLALLIESINWRGSLTFLAEIGAVLAVLIYLIVRDKPAQPIEPLPDTVEHHDVDPKNMREVLRGTKAICKDKQTWLVSIYGGLMFGPTTAFAFWGVPYLMEAHHFDKPTAAACVMFIFIGWAIGSPVFGWISDTIGKRLPPMIFGSIGAFLALTGVIYLPHLSIMSIKLLLLLFGIASSGFLLAFSIVKEINLPKFTASALGFVNCLNMLPGALLQPFIGYGLDLLWAGQVHEGIRVYSAANFQMSLAILPLCLLMSIAFLPFIKETNCHPVYLDKKD